MAGAAAAAVLILAAAAMTVAAMVVMAAAHIRIVGKLSPEESCNCRICITSDSHSVDTIFHAFDQAKELAKSCGYQESWVLTKHGFIPQEI